MKSRNRLQRISFLVLSLAALVHGCAWDDSLYNEFVIETENGRGEVVRCGDSLEKIIIYKSDNSSKIYCKTEEEKCEKGDGKYANAFEHKLCPRDAPNCMLEDDGKGGTKGTCRNDCPSAYIVCKGKCLARDDDNQNFSLSYHIQSCINDEVECDEDYYDLDKDVVNGCEIQLSAVHVDKSTPKNSDGSWHCIEDYYDFDQEATNGCEFPLRTIHVKKDSEGKFVCDDDYYDLNEDLKNLKDHKTNDGCEFQLSVVHVDNSTPKNSDGSWHCIEDYYDFDQDATNGCEFQLSVVHVDNSTPKNLDGSWNCKDGYADLDDSRENGCEINGNRDREYCGAGINGSKKGTPCLDTPCVNGVCTETCNYTDLVRCGDYCVNVYASDNAHCGGCDKTCDIDNLEKYDYHQNNKDFIAAVTCGGGYCHATACMPGYRLNVNPNNNDTNNFPNTCTKCNPDEYTTSAMATECKKCPKTPGASTMKFDTRLNMCVPKTCKSGWYYHDPCANSSNNKCTEAAYCDTTQHCTSSAQCANLSAGTSACVNGKCEYACNAGWYYSLNGCTNPPYCCQKCPNGTYKGSSDALCTAVPAGKIGYSCDNTSPMSGCRNYQSCSSKKQCQQMYGSSSWCSSSSYKCRTTINSSYYDSCNMAYDGCPSGKTCKAYDQSTYGYCN